jgi:threonine/homoserine/homoserine lactone efflux protein
MTYELLVALAAFALVSSITPGPNNLMLMASGANFGFRRSIPHMLGIGIGFSLMVAMVGIGFSQIFNSYPLSHLILKILSVTYLLYLAYKIATASTPTKQLGLEDGKARPFTFFQAALFQWVNPKSWTMALTATAVYAPSQSAQAIAVVTGVFGIINLPCVSVWAAMGLQLKQLLTSQRRLRAFNYTMATLLVASLYPVLI